MTTVTCCDQCGQPIGEPHLLLDDDCTLPHQQHAERFMGTICKRHYHWVDRTLVQIEELFALRGFVLLPGPGGDGRGATRTGSPAPGRVEVMALTDRRNQFWRDDDDALPDVPGALYSWVRLMAEEREDDELCNISGDVSTIIGVLRRERRWIAGQAWIEDYTDDLHALHLHVARGVGDSMWPKPIGKCPSCGTPMFPTIGADEATCHRCHRSWSGIHLSRLRLIHEQEAG